MVMQLELLLQDESGSAGAPGHDDFHHWAAAALTGRLEHAELCIRVVGDQASADLNQRFRGREGPTNVLSFSHELPDEVLQALPLRPLGDLVLCAPLVQAEAGQQGKPEAWHWAHLTVHGILHLLGFDHQHGQQAEQMEALEVEILRGLGVPDPYQPLS
jgi:probable rRNA maturation factor